MAHGIRGRQIDFAQICPDGHDASLEHEAPDTQTPPDEQYWPLAQLLSSAHGTGIVLHVTFTHTSPPVHCASVRHAGSGVQTELLHTSPAGHVPQAVGV